MISTDLIVFRRPNRRSFSKFNESFLLKDSKLPSNERIIIRVDICGDKRSIVVNMNSKFFDTLSSKRWEIFCPINRISKIVNLLLRNLQLFHDLILRNTIFLLIFRHLWRVSVCIKLGFEFFSSSCNWHS